MLEYGEAYLAANEKIVQDMKDRMSPGAVALALRMADKADADDAADEAYEAEALAIEEQTMRWKMNIGDLLTFKAATRESYRKATRVIRGFDPVGRPMVGYAGWSDFVVQPKEIISVEKRV